MAEERCYVCNKSEADDPEVEIRPYGKGGQPLCFDCMVADPEREREARRQFDSCLAGAGPVAVLDGSSGGVRAATFDEEQMASAVLPGLPRPGKA